MSDDANQICRFQSRCVQPKNDVSAFRLRSFHVGLFRPGLKDPRRAHTSTNTHRHHAITSRCAETSRGELSRSVSLRYNPEDPQAQ